MMKGLPKAAVKAARSASMARRSSIPRRSPPPTKPSHRRRRRSSGHAVSSRLTPRPRRRGRASSSSMASSSRICMSRMRAAPFCWRIRSPRWSAPDPMTKDPGRFFEDFSLGEILHHATPRTVSEADAALYLALTGTRFAVNSSDPFAQSLGYKRAPLDDVLTFNLVFGKTVPDISVNAVANLGYAAGIFGQPLYPGDTVTARSEVIGLRENSKRQTGTVYVRSQGFNQRGESILDYVRWVMVRKCFKDTAATE